MLEIALVANRTIGRTSSNLTYQYINVEGLLGICFDLNNPHLSLYHGKGCPTVIIILD